MFLMSSTLGASTDNNRLGYTTDKADVFSDDLLSLQPNGYSNLEFKLGMAESLRRFESGYQKNSNFLKRVVVWMSYKF